MGREGGFQLEFLALEPSGDTGLNRIGLAYVKVLVDDIDGDDLERSHLNKLLDGWSATKFELA
jgi:hypothetical protein